MPKLWSDTLEAHRHEVQGAILETTAQLVHQRGLRAVTMSQIAEEVGIGRATLYKYFSDVDAILRAWHETHISGHLNELTELAKQPGSAIARLGSVLERFAAITHASRQHEPGLVFLLHGDGQPTKSEERFRALVLSLVNEAVGEGDLRSDTPASEQTTFCLHAVTSAESLSSQAAVKRLCTLIFDAIRQRPHAIEEQTP